LNEERDEWKKPKGRISDLENNAADAGDGLQQPVLSLFHMNDEMISNDRLHQELDVQPDN
jgi:hypothetical protein